MTRYVLSVDGGGIRGIVSSKILREVEKRLNKPIGEIFDLYVGSSIGAMIVALLALKDKHGAVKYTSEDALRFLLQAGPTIFTTSPLRKILAFLSAKFSATPLERELKKVFEDATMRDIPAHIMIPTYDAHYRRTRMLRNWDSAHKDLLIRDVLRAASAAPSIFPPKKMVIEHRDCLLVDSGLVANNPAACAYAAADFLYQGEEVYCVSVGSGSIDVTSSSVSDNLIFWATSIATMFLDAGMEAVDYQMNRFFGCKGRYIRLTGELRNAASFSFIDASVGSLNALQADSDRIVDENSDKIDKFVKAYKAGKGK